MELDEPRSIQPTQGEAAETALQAGHTPTLSVLRKPQVVAGDAVLFEQAWRIRLWLVRVADQDAVQTEEREGVQGLYGQRVEQRVSAGAVVPIRSLRRAEGIDQEAEKSIREQANSTSAGGEAQRGRGLADTRAQRKAADEDRGGHLRGEFQDGAGHMERKQVERCF